MDDNEKLVLSKSDKRFFYNRSSSNNQKQLQNVIMNHYGCDECYITCSGMKSISMLLHGLCQQIQSQSDNTAINIICSDELYCDTPNTLVYITNTYKNTYFNFVDIENPDEIREILLNYSKSEEIKKIMLKCPNVVNILFLESCSNPHGKVFDFSLIQEFRSLTKQLYVVVDNTWLTEVIFNPFLVDVDFVVMSLTKYYSAGNAIGGAILSKSANKNVIEKIILFGRLNGEHVSPHNCEIIEKNMLTIKSRILTSSEITIDLISQLLKLKHKIVNSIIHPYCSDKVIVKQFFNDNIYPSVLVIRLNVRSKNKLMKTLNHFDKIDFKTSFGYKHTRIDSFPFKNDNDTISIRLSVGYEDTGGNIFNNLCILFDLL